MRSKCDNHTERIDGMQSNVVINGNEHTNAEHTVLNKLISNEKKIYMQIITLSSRRVNITL